MTMNLPRYRAWRFVYPGLDAPEDAAGLRFAPNGGIEMVQLNESIRQALLLLFSTHPGERVMRPDYGCDIHKLVFSPNDDTTAGLAIYYVQRAIDRWERRIDVLRLDAGRDPEAPERLTITLQYRVRVTRHTELLSFSLNLAEGS
jgi:phage baseplate assembly protein W